MNLVYAFSRGLQMFSDIGIGPSIIQNDRGEDREFVDTAWAVQIVRGLIIWAGLALVAYPAAWFYDQPIVAWLLLLVGFTAVLAGFESTAQFTLNRRLAMGKLISLELGEQTIVLLVSIALAIFFRSVWALAIGVVVGRAARTWWSHFLLPGPKNRLTWDREAVRSIVHFGKWILLTSAVGFLASQTDRLILPKLIPMALFGVYGIALLLASAPDQLVAALGYKVIFPATVELTRLPRREMRDRVLRARGPLLCCLAAGASALVVFGDIVVQLLYDERYHAAGWMVAILSLGFWPRMLVNTIGPGLLAIGQPKFLAVSGSLRFALLVTVVPLVAAGFGLVGVVVAIAAINLADYVVESYGLWRHGLQAFWQDLIATVGWLVMIAVLLLVRSSLGMSPPAFLSL